MNTTGWVAMFALVLAMLPGAAQAVTAPQYVAVDANLTHVRIDAQRRKCGFWRKRCNRSKRAIVQVYLQYDYTSPKSGLIRTGAFSKTYRGGLWSLPGFYWPQPKVGNVVKLLVDREANHAAQIPCTKIDSWITRLTSCTSL
jgi:hypothetical protein